MKSKNLPVWILIYLGIIAFFFFSFVAVKSDHKYPVTHFAKVEQTVGDDGRAAAGSDEAYKITISPAKNWQLTNHGVAALSRVFVIIVILAIGLVLYLVSASKINLQNPNFVVVGLMALAAILLYSSHSSALDQNYISVPPDQFQTITGTAPDASLKSVKDNTDSLDAIFSRKYNEGRFIK